MKSLLSPKELAAAIGVSESSIKRWVDEGKVEASRTAGGHRRISMAEVVRFLRESGQKLIEPGLLGLPELQELKVAEPECPAGDLEAQGERLFHFLEAGACNMARGLLLQLYLDGLGLAEIFDGPLRSALRRIGQLWQSGPVGIFLEHRAIQISLQAVHQLAALTPRQSRGPLALGAAAPPDTSQLPTLMVATLLASEGFQAVNLGPDLPLTVLGDAVLDMKPALVWLSISHGGDEKGLLQEVAILKSKVDTVGAALAIGGRAAPRSLGQSPPPRFLLGQSLAELVAFVRGLGLIALS